MRDLSPVPATPPPAGPVEQHYRRTAGPEPLQARTVLPARRERLVLRTADGLDLVGELALPEDAPPRATLVTFHPLPTVGGHMDIHLYLKAAQWLPATAGLAVLRFNTRGTCSRRGCSDGAFGDGVAEREDVAAALALVAERGLPDPWLVGWSFGTELVLQHGTSVPHAGHVRGGILLSPPLRRSTDADLDRWAADGRPLRVLVPGLDDFLRPEEARRRFARVPQAEVVGVEGARHLWIGRTYTRGVLDDVASTALGRPVALPTAWDGPVVADAGEG
ncbi:alpha/beta hydrolase [Citricoccus sp. SGAir0253]|uniref:alpha/beta hydrolase n=1 Tax=Citricoccus sp. SGAir0253 TaxID=2567881 RepID=UPI0010CCDA5A|nr:alpha/beta hydrolase [Citricoccus sp. SGAir0253]QCU78407.1 alpha/beta hydrolase [Citricoccus sp. SGAir0253]